METHSGGTRKTAALLLASLVCIAGVIYLVNRRRPGRQREEVRIQHLRGDSPLADKALHAENKIDVIVPWVTKSILRLGQPL